MSDEGRGGRARVLRSAQALVASVPALAPAALAILLLACVLVPLPTLAVDLLLSGSIATAALLLVAVVRVRRPTELLVFPVLLLCTTLFRLALNVSTTRLILSQADAGRVVDAFAGLVVRGDMIVGAVIFAILTVVQYLVVARGAERVAEVGARFALDALPGQQTAIEADLRSNSISPLQAASARAQLDERSRFFGAMDGAVRLVKGDAMAGLMITAINLVGGVAIGVLRGGLSVGESLELYGRLTIGDGLVAQIPALLVSLAAGLLVARVERSAHTSAEDPLAWLDPAMLLVPAALLGALAVVPGMPRVGFGVVALLSLAAAVWLSDRRGQTVADDASAAGELVLELPAEHARLEGRKARERIFQAAAARVSDALGLDVPPLRVHASAGGPRFVLRLHGVVVASGDAHGLSESAAVDALALACVRGLLHHGEQLVRIQLVEDAIERTRMHSPALVREALARVGVRELHALARGLVRERVPLPPWESVLAVVVDDPAIRAGVPADVPRLIERLRRVTAREWLTDVVGQLGRMGEIAWVRPTPDAEAAADRLTRHLPLSIETTSGEHKRQRFAAALLAGRDAGPTVVLTSEGARPVVAAVLGQRVPFVPVLSREELAIADVTPSGEPVWADVDC